MAKIKQLKDKSGTEQIFPKTKTQAIYNTDGTLLSETLDDLYGSLATIESSPTTTSHSVGEYILYQGQVYKVTSVIASGDSLVVGTNISAVNLGDQISTLNGQVSTLNSKLTSTSLTLTRTNNNYVDATSFGRMAAWKKSGILCLRGNLGPSSAVPNSSGDITIGTISGWNAVSDVFTIVPMQSGSGHLGVTVKANGTIQIYNTCGTAVSGFCRFNVCVPEA